MYEMSNAMEMIFLFKLLILAVVFSAGAALQYHFDQQERDPFRSLYNGKPYKEKEIFKDIRS